MVSSAPPGFPPPPTGPDGAPLPPPKKTSGCLIALIVCGALVLVGVVGLVAFGYWFSTTDKGQVVVKAAQVAAKAAEGPGPDALRAAGCAQGAVLRYAEINEIVKPLTADAGPGVSAEFPDHTEVRCMDPTKPITCEDVGRIYAAAEKPNADFAAIVSGNGQDLCNVRMKPDGTPR
jgi:hypothetical protein